MTRLSFNTRSSKEASVKALVTGFEPYAGRGLNPAAEVARALDGRQVGGLEVTGMCLPVSLAEAPSHLITRIEQLQPDITLCLGLWPGEPMIRLERIALNRADFEIPDASGRMVRDEALEPGGPDGVHTTLPLHDVLQALWSRGIPARLSGTAGTFLCNAILYQVLRHAQRRRPRMLAGFMHLPYLPSQVAILLEDIRREQTLELHQRADLASMDLQTMLAAVQVTLTASAERSSP
jgi:pyroglutamyl-peptidase